MKCGTKSVKQHATPVLALVVWTLGGTGAFPQEQAPGSDPGSGVPVAQPVEDGPGAIVAQPVPGAPRAMDPKPFEPPALPFAEPISPMKAATAKATGPTGPTVSPLQAQGRLIETTRPERVQVYPDDPESAWWEINPHFAFDRAQREQKPMLLLFTGQWNNHAMALSEEVFATKSFNEFVKENLVICYLNYERNITDNPDVLRRIKEKFKVKGYPNVLLFNPNGDVEKGIRGYRTGRPVDYFNRLRAACLPILQSIEAQKAELVRYGYRDWSNYMGKVIFAKFLAQNGTKVQLQDASGEKWIIKINDLAPPDQLLVESFPPVESLDPKDD